MPISFEFKISSAARRNHRFVFLTFDHLFRGRGRGNQTKKMECPGTNNIVVGLANDLFCFQKPLESALTCRGHTRQLSLSPTSGTHARIANEQDVSPQPAFQRKTPPPAYTMAYDHVDATYLAQHSCRQRTRGDMCTCRHSHCRAQSVCRGTRSAHS